MDSSNSKITIINKALSHLKQRTIVSLDEDSEQARKANLFYDCSRRSTLRACDWRFATVKKKLTLLGDIETAQLYPADNSKQDFLPEWSYTYAYPGDCVRLRKAFNAQKFINITPWNDRTIVDSTGRVPLFEVARSPITNQMAVACNLPDAYAEITVDMKDETQFDDMFQDALAWVLADDLAIPLSCDMELALYVEKKANEALAEAKRKNGGEGLEMAPRQSNYEAVRQGYDYPY